jgi:hypothetical protein
MSGYLSKNGYVLKKEDLSPEDYQKLKEELRCRPITDEKYNFGKDISFPVYTETKNKIYIPKMYGIQNFGKTNKYLPNYIGKKWENDITFVGQLLPHQIEPVNILEKACLEDGGGILQLGTGLGKTISSLCVLSKLKSKTIIVVNKIPLMKQWEREIKQFLPDARIGFIQGQKNIKLENTDIVIAMLQSLARVDYPDSFFEDFSVCLIDEIHNTSSRVFSNVLKKLCSKYTIGLSATPKRSDGCEYVFKWHIGDIVYKSDTKREGLPPIIKLVKLKSDDYKENTIQNKTTGQNQIQYSSMINDLISMPKRNEYIIKCILDCVKENRTILLMSDRRTHLQNIHKLLQELNVSFTYGLFLGQMKSKDLDKSMSCQVILATYSAFSEGVSKKDLDTLMLISPKKYIGHLKNASKNESGKMEQIVGRIFRKDHLTIAPMIIDFCDDFSIYKNQSFQRKTFYKLHFKNYQLCKATVDLNNDIIEEISEPVNNSNSSFQTKTELNLHQNFANSCLIDDE